MDIFNMLQGAQQKMEEMKIKLDAMVVTAEAGNGGISITATGNKKITNISISPDILADNDVDALEDLLMVAFNRVLEKAEALSQQEMDKLSHGILPPIF